MTGLDNQPPYFTDITPLTDLLIVPALSRIAEIIGIEGDVQRGKKPFPHPFPARMPMEVAEAAVMALSEPGDVILDPMMGSGVVPRAALGLGRRAIGVDIDPLAVIQSRALCASCDASELARRAGQAKEAAERILKSGGTKQLWRALEEEDRNFVEYWFERQHADELFALSAALKDYSGKAIWPILATILSSLIISRDSGASRARDLARSRPHRVDDKIPKSPFADWNRKVVAFSRHYETRAVRRLADLSLGDARHLKVGDESVDAVITSPPYVNAIDYMRMSKFTLIFLGSRLSELRNIRAKSVGTEVGLAAGHLPHAFDRLIDLNVSDPRRRPMLRHYVQDMRAALSETHRVLKPGGRVLYVLGPSILSRRDYDAADVLKTIAEDVGLVALGQGRRDLHEARRSLPPPRRSQRALAINKRMTCEFYVILQKDL